MHPVKADLKAPHVDRIENLAEGHWLSLQKVHWTDGKGKQRLWDRAVRTSHARRQDMISNGQDIVVHGPDAPECIGKPDATSILALCYHKSRNQEGVPLRERDDVELLMISQFRPPLGTYSLEFPAGLIDEGETPEEAGLRELKEETGYTAEKVLFCSPSLTLSPGSQNETSVLLGVQVDLDDPINQNPIQMLDESEVIHVMKIPLKTMMEEFDKFTKEGGLIFSEIYCTAVGLLVMPSLQLLGSAVPSLL